MTVAMACNCYGKLNYNDELDDDAVIKNNRPFRSPVIVYDKERLLNNTHKFTVEKASVNIQDSNEFKDIQEKLLPIIKTLPTYNENSLSSILGTPLQPNLNNVFVILKTVYQDKTILQKKGRHNIKVTFRI